MEADARAGWEWEVGWVGGVGWVGKTEGGAKEGGEGRAKVR